MDFFPPDRTLTPVQSPSRKWPLGWPLRVQRRSTCAIGFRGWFGWKLLALGWFGGLLAHASRTSGDAAAAAFFAGPILRWELTLPEDSLAKLRSNSRESVRGELRVGTHHLAEVGFHLKGSAGSKRPVDDKPSWTLKLDHFRSGQQLFGETKFHLNNAAQDSTYLNQNLASRVYRAAGIPATRSSHALVTLNGRELGLYVVVESYDSRYLRRAFPEEAARPGNLYEGGFVSDIERNLERDAGNGPDDHSDLQALRRAVDAPPELRPELLPKVLDTNQFLTLAAIQIALDDWDGYLRNRNNYRIHFRRNDGRAVFLPSGIDQLLVHADAPVREGWRGKVATAWLGLPGPRLQLRARLRELSTTVLSEQFLTNELAHLQSRLDIALANLPTAVRDSILNDRDRAPIRVHQRLTVVARELAEWADPLPPWPAGHRVTPTGWTSLLQNGQAEVDLPADGSVHLAARAPGTIVSVRTSLTLPAGTYRLVGRARSRAVVPITDEFGSGAGLRLTGSSRTQQLSGDRDWTSLYYHFSQSDDGPVTLVLELRAQAGDVWFEGVEVVVDPAGK